MRITRHGTVLGVLAACLLLAPAAAEEPAEIELPRIGTLGRLPDAAMTDVVEIDADGRISIDGVGPLGLEALRDALRARSKDATPRGPYGASPRILLVNADARLPWAVAQWVMQAAAHPDVQIYKIFFGARPKEGEEKGAIGWMLPMDRGLDEVGPEESDAPNVATMSVLAFAREGASPSSPELLAPHLADARREAGAGARLHVELKAPPPHGDSVPVGTMLEVLGVLAASDVEFVTFEGRAPPRQGSAAVDLQVVAMGLRGADTTPFLRTRNHRIAFAALGGPRAAPQPRGLVDALVGFGGADRAEEPGFVPPQLPLMEEIEEDPVIRDAEIEDLPFEEMPEEEEEDTVEELGDLPFDESLGADDPPMPADTGGAFAGRMRHRQEGGASTGSGRAIELALAWLAAHQAPDGSWGAASYRHWCNGQRVEDGPEGVGKPVYDVGTTGLAVLAFLSAGYGPRGEHPYARTVFQGLDHLIRRQHPSGGGRFGDESTGQYVYNHAIATLALVEAYGMTGNGVYRDAAQAGLNYITRARNPYFAWRYGIRPGDNDTSVTGWMMMAIHAARQVNVEAANRPDLPPLRVDPAADDGVRAWLDKMTDADYGRTGYIQRGGSPARQIELIDRFPGDKSEAMTAVGIVLRHVIGDAESKRSLIRKSVKLCLALRPRWDEVDGSIDMIYWYYGTLAMKLEGGSSWSLWRRPMLEALLRNQRKDGDACDYRGSWDPAGAWGQEGGRVYATALMARLLAQIEAD